LEQSYKSYYPNKKHFPLFRTSKNYRREEQEKDTEVERVLEQQAEFIEKFEAEESAQRAWEAQYEEQIKAKGEEQRILASHENQKISVNHEIVEVIYLARFLKRSWLTIFHEFFKLPLFAQFVFRVLCLSCRKRGLLLILLK
jgi:hypothetical protein